LTKIFILISNRWIEHQKNYLKTLGSTQEEVEELAKIITLKTAN